MRSDSALLSARISRRKEERHEPRFELQHFQS